MILTAFALACGAACAVILGLGAAVAVEQSVDRAMDRDAA